MLLPLLGLLALGAVLHFSRAARGKGGKNKGDTRENSEDTLERFLRQQKQNEQLTTQAGKEGKDMFEAVSGVGNGYSPEESVMKLLEASPTLRRLAKKIELTQAKAIVSQVKVGENRIISLEPTDDIEINPIDSLNDIPNILTSQHGQDDDMFYINAVSKNLTRMNFIGSEGIYEDRYNIPKKMLIVVSDVSGSMEKQFRAHWELAINTILLKKAHDADADYVMQTFNDGPKRLEHMVAGDERQYMKMYNELTTFFYPKGGTNIDSTLNSVIGYISDMKKGEMLKLNKEKQDTLSEDLEIITDIELVLITDGTESINTDELKEKMIKHNIRLHTICIGEENDQLRNFSTKYDFISDSV